MATLEKIRNKAGLLVGIVGLALFAFIIGDLLNSGSSILNKNQNNVLVVNGEAVDYQEYMSLENELTEVYKIQSGSSNLSEAYVNQIRQVIYDDVVMEKIMAPRYEDLGIEVTAEEMLDMTEGENISPVLLQLPLFQNQQTGQFDRNQVINFLNQIKNIDMYPATAQAQLSQYRLLWLFWEKNIKRNRLSEKYTNLLSKAITANSLDAKDEFANSSVSSDIAFVMESFASLNDTTITASNAELEKLYNERKEMFRQSETTVIDYIAFDITPSQDDYDKVSKEMDGIRAEVETTDNIASLTNEKSERKYINAFFSVAGFGTDEDITKFVAEAKVGDIEGPVFKDNTYRILKLVDKTEAADSVNVLEMLLAPRATESESRAYADSLLQVIKNGGDFKELVKQYSVDQLVEKDGELGWITESGALQGINEEFKNTVFSLPAGQSAIVKSNFGLHIVKVTEKTKPVAKYKIADIVYTVTPSSATRSQLYNHLNQFIVKNNSIELIEANAKDAGFDLVTNARVVSTDQTVGTITGARQVVRWAFNSKKGQIADEIFECDGKFIVAANKGKLPEGYQSLIAVTPQLKAEIIAQKKGEKIAADLKAKNLTSLSSYAETIGVLPDTVRYINMATSRITKIGSEPKLNALIAAAPLNTLSEPVVGNNGVYVFEVINRTNEDFTYDEKQTINMINANNAYKIGGLAFRNIQQKAKIVDNRIRFY
ncbi:MAG: SurA N-terminal domain-containing protein [Tannerella sp.]|jgi:peptidyl-prolyl cis-trans isomerase D|nr:SurA N-terminal domain-containing protein [Tannerella sp.]